jgi:hypothetical protein
LTFSEIVAMNLPFQVLPTGRRMRVGRRP